MAGIAAMGITVTYAGVPLVATSFNVNDQIDTADGSHFGISPGGRREYVPTFVQREISCDYIGTSVITTQSAAISIVGGGNAGALSFSGNATLTASTCSGQVGDLIKGQATWRVA
ncbi:MAG: hypothetical protein EB078_01455 [Proteobacteria bacterium]|nr:hypothetical protein [Pseudomonadota bacterium]